MGGLAHGSEEESNSRGAQFEWRYRRFDVDHLATQKERLTQCKTRHYTAGLTQIHGHALTSKMGLPLGTASRWLDPGPLFNTRDKAVVVSAFTETGFAVGACRDVLDTCRS